MRGACWGWGGHAGRWEPWCFTRPQYNGGICRCRLDDDQHWKESLAGDGLPEFTGLGPGLMQLSHYSDLVC